MNDNDKKPLLIILEGPAGVGKTTVQLSLQEELELRNIAVGILPEFSKNSLDQLIKNKCSFGQIKPEWLTGISGLLLFLSQKINKIKHANVDTEKVWICDRFITTEFVLGFQSINANVDLLYAEQMVRQVYEWSLEKISKNSILLFLDCNTNILKERLEARIKRKLTSSEYLSLKNQIQGYRKLAENSSSLNTFIINGSNTIDEINDEILNILSERNYGIIL